MKNCIVMLALLSLVLSAGAQTYTVSGVLSSHISHQPLTDAFVWLQGVPDTIHADASGHYVLYLATGIFFVYFGGASSCDSLVTVAINHANITLNLELLEAGFECSVTSISQITWPGHDTSADFTLANPDAECPLSFVISDTSDWLDATPANGEIQPDSTLQIIVWMSGDIEWEQDYLSVLRIDYNGANSPYVIPVTLAVLLDRAGNAKPPIPKSISLSAYPNPFNPAATISFSLAHSENVALNVFDISGRNVATLANSVFEQGEHSVTFDGSALPSGIYFARIEVGAIRQTQKLMLLK